MWHPTHSLPRTALPPCLQVTLPATLGPLLRCRSFVLVGDHNQLPPLVANKEAEAGGLGVSLFRRLAEAHPAAVVALPVQYRMAADIMALPNALIYGNQVGVRVGGGARGAGCVGGDAWRRCLRGREGEQRSAARGLWQARLPGWEGGTRETFRGVTGRGVRLACGDGGLALPAITHWGHTLELECCYITFIPLHPAPLHPPPPHLQLVCGSEGVAQAALALSSAGASALAASCPPWVTEALAPARRVVFLDTGAAPAPESASIGDSVCNQGEAAAVVALLRAAVQTAGLAQERLGVISPYRSQVGGWVGGGRVGHQRFSLRAVCHSRQR